MLSLVHGTSPCVGRLSVYHDVLATPIRVPPVTSKTALVAPLRWRRLRHAVKRLGGRAPAMGLGMLLIGCCLFAVYLLAEASCKYSS